MADRTRLYTRQPNGRIPYFSAAQDELSSGALSPGANTADLEAAGYMEASPEDFLRQRQGYADRLASAHAVNSLIQHGSDGPARVAYHAEDGSTPYFRSEPGFMEEGAIPKGGDASSLSGDGYVFADKGAYDAAHARLDPMRPPEPQDAALAKMADDSPSDVDALAKEMDTPYPSSGDSPEDVDALAKAFDASRAPAVARQNAAVDAAMKRGPVPSARAAPAPARPGVSVQRAPSSVALASPLGGTALPTPDGGLARAMAQQEGTASKPAEETLADVQQRAAQQRALAGLARAGSRMGAAIAGVKPEDGAADDLEKGADQTVRDYLQRKQAAEFDKQKAEEDALKDPTSAQSKRFQMAVSKALPGVYSPEEITLMAASDKDTVLNLGKMRATLDERAQQAKEDRSSRESIAAENRAAREAEARQRSLDRGLQWKIAQQNHQDALKAKEGQKEEDFERKMAERNVGGYTFDPKNPPTADGAKQMAHITTARDEVLAGLDNLEQKIKENGSEMFGATAGDMESDWMNITNRLRNLNQMGVPNGKDYEMLAKQLVDPTSMAAMTTSSDRMLQQIKTLRRQMGQTVDATAKAYKFRPAGGGATASAAPPPAPDGMLNIRLPDGSLKQIPAARRAEAERDFNAMVL